MAKLEDILKAQGWSDQELAESPLLKDQRFRTSLETSYGAIETQANQFRTKAEEYEAWRNDTANPAIVAAEDDAKKARLEAARAKELLSIAKEYGYIDDEKIAAHAGNTSANDKNSQQVPAGFDPDKYVTRDFANQFAVGQGRAMALYQDISSEHQRLFGAPIENFSSLYDKFLNVSPLERGKVTIRDIWERENNVPAKREEIRLAAQAAHDKKIRDEATAEVEKKYAMQRGNPLLASPVVSRQPFIPARTEAGKQPWEQPRGEMKERRLQNAMERQHESTKVN